MFVAPHPREAVAVLGAHEPPSGTNKAAAWRGRGRARLCSALVGVCFLLPLVVCPGLDQPFSTPKLAFLVIVVAVGDHQ